MANMKLMPQACNGFIIPLHKSPEFTFTIHHYTSLLSLFYEQDTWKLKLTNLWIEIKVFSLLGYIIGSYNNPIKKRLKFNKFSTPWNCFDSNGEKPRRKLVFFLKWVSALKIFTDYMKALCYRQRKSSLPVIFICSFCINWVLVAYGV